MKEGTHAQEKVTQRDRERRLGPGLGKREQGGRGDSRPDVDIHHDAEDDVEGGREGLEAPCGLEVR
jgi:hypothetical protein